MTLTVARRQAKRKKPPRDEYGFGLDTEAHFAAYKAKRKRERRERTKGILSRLFQ